MKTLLILGRHQVKDMQGRLWTRALTAKEARRAVKRLKLKGIQAVITKERNQK